MNPDQKSPAKPASPAAEAWDAPLPERPDPAAGPGASPTPGMTLERHRAILMQAVRTGSWEEAERATRSVAWQHLLARIGRLLRRLPWRARR